MVFFCIINKQKYEELEKQDRERFYKEKKEYQQFLDSKIPKRPACSFALFLKDFSQSHKDISTKDLIKIAAKEWKLLDNEEKKVIFIL